MLILTCFGNKKLFRAHSLKSVGLTVLVFLATVLSLQTAAAVGRENESDIQRLSEKLEKETQEILQQEFSLVQGSHSHSLHIAVRIDIDSQAWRNAVSAWFRDAEANRLARIERLLKNPGASLPGDTDPNPTESPPNDPIRVGMFSVRPKSDDTAEKVPDSETMKLLMFSELLTPADRSSGITSLLPTPLEHIMKIGISIRHTIPITGEEVERLKTELYSALNLGLYLDSESQAEVSFTQITPKDWKSRLEEPSNTKPTWLQNFLDPINGSVWTLLIAVLGTFVIILASRITSQGMRSIGASLEKASATQAEAAQVGKEPLDAPQVVDVEIDGPKGETQATPVDSQYGSQLKAQLREAIESNPEAVGRAIVSIHSQAPHAQTLPAVLQLLGFREVQPVLEALSSEPRRLLKGVLENSQSRQISADLMYAEVQNLLNEVSSRLAFLEVNAEKNSRGTLEKLYALNPKEIRHIAQHAAQEQKLAFLQIARQDQAIILLQTLDADEARNLMSQMSEGTKELDASMALIEQLLAADRQIEENEQSGRMQHLLLSWFQSAPQSKESEILDLFDRADWQGTENLLKLRIPTLWLKFIPKESLTQALTRLGFARLAQLCLSLQENLREYLLSLYPEGTKARDSLNDEIQRIQEDRDEMIAVKKDGEKIIQNFQIQLSQTLSKNASLLDIVILNMVEEWKIEPPQRLKNVADLIKSVQESQTHAA